MWLRRHGAEALAIKGNAHSSREALREVGLDVPMKPFGGPILRSQHQNVLRRGLYQPGERTVLRCLQPDAAYRRRKVSSLPAQ